LICGLIFITFKKLSKYKKIYEYTISSLFGQEIIIKFNENENNDDNIEYQGLILLINKNYSSIMYLICLSNFLVNLFYVKHKYHSHELEYS